LRQRSGSTRRPGSSTRARGATPCAGMAPGPMPSWCRSWRPIPA